MRLTYRDNTVPHTNAKGEWWEAYSDANYNEVINKLAAYEDMGLEPEEIKLNMDGLDDYHKAEAQGLLVRLPCKVGDTVYRIQYVADPKSPSGYVIGVEPLKFSLIFIDEVGKYVFLTREEAEAALKGEAKDV